MNRTRNTLIGALALGAVLSLSPAAALADAADRAARTLNRIEAKIVGLESIDDLRRRQREILRIWESLDTLEAQSANMPGKQARRNDARIDQLQSALRGVERRTGAVGLDRNRRGSGVWDDRDWRLGGPREDGEGWNDRRQRGNVPGVNDGGRQAAAATLSARLNALETQLNQIRNMRSPHRRQDRIFGLDRELLVLSQQSATHRGRLARENDARIEQLRYRLSQMDPGNLRRGAVTGDSRTESYPRDDDWNGDPWSGARRPNWYHDNTR